MSEHRSNFELAAEITIAAISTNATSWIREPDAVAKFYRTIYKEITICSSTPLKDLD